MSMSGTGDHTQAKGEEVRKRPRCIVHQVELASLKDGVPIGCIPTEGFGDSVSKGDQGVGVEKT